MGKITKITDKILKYIIITFSISMVLIIFAQVVTRYVLRVPLSWSEELSRYLFIWVIFLGTAVAVGNKSHIIIDFIIRYLPVRFKVLGDLIVNIIVAVYLAIIIYSSFKLLPIVSGSLTSALQVSYAYVYAALPISGVITIIYLVDNIINDVSKLRKEV
jgi:TRAP-type C4-dicarboxylate transport system permease small subunit